ncbi:MAG: DUF3322 domain-containing protein [Akkermansiaceae bacterium]|jgi:hypothetical protein|nr:DUF3322 domain-containing protein [Akkermansiaceae bacterium]
MSTSGTPAWTSPADIRARLRRRWQRGEILASAIHQDALFPLRLPLKGPSSAQITADFGAARDWIATWRNQTLVPLEWRGFSHRLFGDNEMPAAALFPDAQSTLQLLGTRREWDVFQEMIRLCRDGFPEFLAWLARRAITAVGLADDWPAILATVAWVRDHPRSGLFPRQIDAPGVHTKLIEQHRGVLAELLDRALPADAIDHTAHGAAGFARRYGFRDKPERVRIRFLDPACAIAPERLGRDLTLDAAAFAALDPPVEHVFITENEVNFLAFPGCPRSLVIFGSGYGWGALAAAAWLHHRTIHYWGDIDTHGFAILDQLRASFPHVESLLMDREILLDFEHFWSAEPNPVRRTLPRLTPSELAAYHELSVRSQPVPPRLEQEKLPYSLVVQALHDLGLRPG